jgi:ferrous iron transport protein A
MPLLLAKPGEKNAIKRIGGRDDTKKRLETLGFVVGCPVTVVSEINGNVIVNVKDSRIAISREMANKIMIEPVSNSGWF